MTQLSEATVVTGCSIDGLKNRVFQKNVKISGVEDFYLADVIVPDHGGGNFITGIDAERSRISSGLIWPPEASIKISSDNLIRRIPVAWAWRLLIDSKDKSLRWNIGKGVGFDISRIIAAHTAECLKEVSKDQKIVLAIPNDLDEFGQDKLLRSLRNYGFNDSLTLVWRPVAAALMWLDSVQKDLKVAGRNSEFILVVHVGPDAIEFASFYLREKEYKNKRFITPLRKYEQRKCTLCGCDWAADLIQQYFSHEDLSTVWRAFTNFPEIWRILAQRELNSEHLPKVCSKGNSWVLWEPDDSWEKSFLNIKASPSNFLEKITLKHCEHKRDSEQKQFTTWKEYLLNGIVEALNSHKNAKLVGLIFSGPLASSFPEKWLTDIKDTLISHGLDFEISKNPEINKIWVPAVERDIVSEGASLYGHRLLRGEPTYFDILPQLYTLANKRGKQDWVPLIKGNLETEGGKTHKSTSRLFSLKRNVKTLDVWLKKEDEVYKKASFLFPYAPAEEMPLDTEIITASASGLAQVELIPEEKEFLGGQRVFLDYTRMTESSLLPVQKIGFPEIEILERDEDDYRLLSSQYTYLWEQFLSTDISDEKYCERVGSLRREIERSRRFNSDYKKYGRIVNQEGQTRSPDAQVILKKITDKLGQDFKRLIDGDLSRKYRIQPIIAKHIYYSSTWLFGAAPPEILDYIRNRLLKMSQSVAVDNVLDNRCLIYGAGRCFNEQNDIQQLYESAIRRMDEVRNSRSGVVFPIEYLRTMWRLLSLRELAPDAMNRNQAMIFVKVIIERMEEKVKESQFSQVFFQSIRTFVFLLRYRIVDSTFLSYDSKTDKSYFERIIFCLNAGIRSLQKVSHTRKSESAQKLLEEIKKYMYFEGSENILNLLEEVIEDGDEEKG